MSLLANTRHIYFVAFMVIGFLWGLNWPAVKYILTEMPPLTMRAVAFTAAAVILFIVVYLLRQPLRIKKEEFIPTAVVGVFLIFGFNVLTAFGQVLLETSKATIIAYTMPSLTAILATIYLRERIGFKVLVALLMAMGGLAVLASENLVTLIEHPLGPVIMLLAALSWSIGNVGLKSRNWRLQPLPLTVWFFTFSSLVIWPLVFIYEPIWHQDWPSIGVIGALAFHILGPMITCYILWAFLIARLPTTIAAISVLTAPVVGVVSSILFLDDVLTWQKCVSLTAIILSISVASRQSSSSTS